MTTLTKSNSTSTLESPFEDAQALDATENSGIDLSVASAGMTATELESPFRSGSDLTSSQDPVDQDSEDYVSFVGEIFDQEFNTALAELIGETAAFIEREDIEGNGDVGNAQLQQLADLHFQPLTVATDKFLDSLADGLETFDFENSSEHDLDVFLEGFVPGEEALTPEFDEFFKKLARKVKKTVKNVAKSVRKKAGKLVRKARSAVRSGIRAATNLANRFNPIAIALRKLKRLVRPLLLRVLKAAVGKLPVPLQPIAMKLGRQFLREASPEFEDIGGDIATYEVSELQRDLDIQIANLLFADDETEEDYVVSSYEHSANDSSEGAGRVIEEAVAQFVEEFESLEEGEDPTPTVERFVTAILPALRLGIRLIGRRRVVNFLSGQVARLIGRFVGPRYTRPLSRAIVDSGLKLLNLEEPGDSDEREGAEAVARTVLDTVREVVAFEDQMLDDESLLESGAHEAFVRSAIANLPPQVLKPEHRPATQVSGAWVNLPRNGKKRRRGRRYKKFSRVMNATISPGLARRIKTFGGKSLAHRLRSRLGRRLNSPLRAKVHVFEVGHGGWPSLISANETVPGLASPSPAAWSQLHPLTPEIAGMLVGEPDMGRDIDAEFLESPHRLAVGQRLYFLEMEGPQAVTTPGRKSSPEVSDVFLKLNLTEGQIQTHLYLSESDAQEIARQIRKSGSAGPLMQVFRSVYQPAINEIATGQNPDHVEIVGLLQPPVNPSIPKRQRIAAMALLGPRLKDWMSRSLVTYIKSGTPGLIPKAELPDDGITISLVFSSPETTDMIKRVLTGQATNLSLPAGVVPGEGVPVSVKAGFDLA